MQSITAEELRERIADGEDIQLIDVRELWEHEEFNIGGALIPLNSILENIDFIEKEKPVVFYCQKGIRSQIAIQKVLQKRSYTNLYNLVGGMSAWKKPH